MLLDLLNGDVTQCMVDLFQYGACVCVCALEKVKNLLMNEPALFNTVIKPFKGWRKKVGLCARFVRINAVNQYT